MYILKIILIICILEISTKIGFILSRKLKKVVDEYKILEDIFVFIESKIKYNQNNIIDIFDEIIKQNVNNNFNVLFTNINSDLKLNKYSLSEIVEQNIKKYQYLFSCKLLILQELANKLGKSDVENQIKDICLSKERIKLLIDDATEKKKKNEKVYRTLGIVCGITVAIILI